MVLFHYCLTLTRSLALTIIVNILALLTVTQILSPFTLHPSPPFALHPLPFTTLRPSPFTTLRPSPLTLHPSFTLGARTHTHATQRTAPHEDLEIFEIRGGVCDDHFEQCE
jgi:hypothetical protein